MSRRMWGLSFVTVMALVVVLGCTTTALAAGKTVSKPVLSAAPVMGVPFVASGITTPTAKKGVRVVVKVQVMMLMNEGKYVPMDPPVKAVVDRRDGKPGYSFAQELTIAMTGKHAVRARRYENGRLVATSKLVRFDVMEMPASVSIVATSHADVTAAAGVPLTIVFSDIGVGCGRNIHFQKASLFTKTSADPLTYETAGLVAGSYAWECSMGPLCHGGMLVVK